MAERYWFPESEGVLVIAFPRTQHLLAGAGASLGSALWQNAAGPLAGIAAVGGALTLLHTLAVALIAVLAMLVATAGTLVAADWRANVQSRQAWGQLDVAVAQFSLPGNADTPWKIDPRYLPAADNEALRSVFRAHRFAPALRPEPTPVRLATADAVRLAESCESTLAPLLLAATAKISCDNATNTAAASEIAISRQATGKAESATRAKAPALVASHRGLPQRLVPKGRHLDHVWWPTRAHGPAGPRAAKPLWRVDHPVGTSRKSSFWAAIGMIEGRASLSQTLPQAVTSPRAPNRQVAEDLRRSHAKGGAPPRWRSQSRRSRVDINGGLARCRWPIPSWWTISENASQCAQPSWM